MRLLAAVAAFAACIVTVSADCANACSGHGLCKDKDQCQCDPGYQGADCSLRTCPFAISFVDTPRGDLNHNGLVETSLSSSEGYVKVQWSNVEEYETFPADKALNNEAHFYEECSGKGACNRDTGECACFPGFTGSACQRTACPNDCSGNGVCRTIREVAAGGLNKFVSKSLAGFKHFTGVRTPFDYNRWDADKQQTCICDPGFTGPDCSQRMCPRGDDPLTTGSRWCGGSTCTWEKQSFTLSSSGLTTFRIAFTDSFNKTHIAYAAVDASQNTGYVAPEDQATKLPGPLTGAGAILNALRSIPGGLLQRVEVYPKGNSGADERTFVVTFVGVPGDQAPLSVTVYEGPGSLSYNPDHPLYGSGSEPASIAVVEVANGNYEEIECSGRGLCDTKTGVCKCFAGFAGEACSMQSALAM